jgi:hypothetical protein
LPSATPVSTRTVFAVSAGTVRDQPPTPRKKEGKEPPLPPLHHHHHQKRNSGKLPPERYLLVTDFPPLTQFPTIKRLRLPPGCPFCYILRTRRLHPSPGLQKSNVCTRQARPRQLASTSASQRDGREEQKKRDISPLRKTGGEGGAACERPSEATEGSVPMFCVPLLHRAVPALVAFPPKDLFSSARSCSCQHNNNNRAPIPRSVWSRKSARPRLS